MPVLAEKMRIPTKDQIIAALIERHGSENQERLAAATVGIAGLGGLGSHIAVHLARTGVGKLVLTDFDTVDISNLNRQHYFVEHLSQLKTEALASQLISINPYLEIEMHTTKVTANNAASLFKDCTVICEAFDQADQKAMLVETLLSEMPDIPVISGSGMAGCDSGNTIKTTHPLGNLYLCGDRESDVEVSGALYSSRVGICAGHEATMAIRLILGQTEP